MSDDVDWDHLFGDARSEVVAHRRDLRRLSETTPDVALEAMTAAKRHGTVVSYDLNYRPSLWRAVGGAERAPEVNRALAPLVDVMIGNEEDFTAASGIELRRRGRTVRRSRRLPPSCR